jgi:hypothetical protein
MVMVLHHEKSDNYVLCLEDMMEIDRKYGMVSTISCIIYTSKRQLGSVMNELLPMAKVFTKASTQHPPSNIPGNDTPAA